MHSFVIIFALLAVAAARPDIGLRIQQQGYSYNRPGAVRPQQQHHSSGGGFSAGSNQHQGYNNGPCGGRPAGNCGGSGGGLNSNFGGSGGNCGGSGGNFGGSGGNSGGSSLNCGGSGGNFGGSGGNFGGSGGNFGGSGGNFGGSGGNFGDSGANFGVSGGGSSGGASSRPVIIQGEPEILRNYYVHEAPQSFNDDYSVQEKEIVVRPKKQYKIIFIKVAGGNSYGGSNPAIYPQNEEKTIVYVLSKKSEVFNDEGEFSTPPPQVTSKPEVFFVKYKNQQEAEGAIAQIQESFKEGGSGYISAASFAKNLGASSGSAGSSSLTLDDSDAIVSVSKADDEPTRKQ